jgi:hypothetical protein
VRAVTIQISTDKATAMITMASNAARPVTPSRDGLIDSIATGRDGSYRLER